MSAYQASAILLTSAVSALSAPSWAADCGEPIYGPQLVLNGDFENASYSGCPNSCFTSCGFSIANWTRGGFYSEDLARNLPNQCGELQPFNPNGGAYYVSVQGSVCCGCNNNGSVRQDIAVVAGGTYLVEMDIVIDEYDSLQVSLGGVVETFSPANTSTNVWTRVSRIVQCTTSGGQIRIAATGTPSAPNCLAAYYSYVDNVSVRQIIGTGPCPDCNSDGIPDADQVARGDLADFDGSGVPDCCESGAPCVLGNYPVLWRTEDGGNGHWYMAVRPFGTVTDWSMAQSYALARGGYLMTVTSEGEQAVLERLFMGSQSCQGDRNGVFLGGRQAPGNVPGVGWSWVSGETWSYTNWAPTEPNDFAGFAEDYLMMVTEDRKWYDVVLGGAYLPCAYSAVIEWSVDCNSDGLVDYGQILRGELADTNADGVPDQCVPVRVPQQYPTIQSAIDAAPAGDLRVIEVAPGTYVESIDLKGKPVRIRGAGAAVCTIQSPPGAQVSVVRLSGEPSSAMLEGFTIRGGQVGTPLPWLPAARGGGAVFGNQSGASLTDCVLEQNIAGFGAGVYMWRCTGSIRGCTFRGNSATGDGGAIQLNSGAMVVEDTLVQGNFANGRAGGVHVTGGNHVLRRIHVLDNEAYNVAGGLSFVTFAQYDPPTVSLVVEGCRIEDNFAGVSQGGFGVLDDTPQTVQVLVRGTIICGNLPRPNSSGPWADGGGNQICDCRGDVNTDGRVDGIDLATLLSQWGSVAPGVSGDLNRDGSVDGVDLANLLAAWGNCPE